MYVHNKLVLIEFLYFSSEVEYGTLIQTDSHNETPDSSVPDKFTGNTADAENEQ